MNKKNLKYLSDPKITLVLNKDNYHQLTEHVINYLAHNM